MFAISPPPGALRAAIEPVAVASPWVTWKRAISNWAASTSRHPLGTLYVSSFAGSASFCRPGAGTASARSRQAVAERIPGRTFAVSMVVVRASVLGEESISTSGLKVHPRTDNGNDFPEALGIVGTIVPQLKIV